MRRSSLPYLLGLALSASCHRAASDVPDSTASNAAAAQGIRLSRDADTGTDVRQCLANAQGVVPRYTDDEPYAAVDPRDARRVIAVWQSRSGSGHVIQHALSEDGGLTWTMPRAVPINACAGGPAGTGQRSSDPWASFGPDGRAYLSAIAWTPTAGGDDSVSTLVLVASPDGGRTWEPPVLATLAPSGVAYDNLATAADPTRPQTVYAATTRIQEPSGGGYFGRLGFTRSTDGGRSWEPVASISPSVNGERVGAPQIVLDPRSGRLYAVYHRRLGDHGVVGVKISDDAGATWSDEFIAAGHARSPRTFHPRTGERFVLATDIVQAVVSPATGELIVAYADAGRGRTAVSVVRSADGRRWSQPVEVSRTQHVAWLPAIAVQADGDIAVSYYVANFTAGQSDPRMRVMLQRLPRSATDTVSPPPIEIATAPLAWPGDYQVLVASGDGFVSVYGAHTDILARRIDDPR